MANSERNIIRLDSAIPTFSGPGLIDLQVNGINGVDFNDERLTEEDVLKASHFLLSRGITSFCPTIITAPDEKVIKILEILVRSIEKYSLVADMILGFHLEGPFLSPEDGARGAHDIRYIKAPDWDLIARFQEVAEGRILLLTLAPEWAGSTELIAQCKQHGILVSMGHSMAKGQDISAAVDAGLALSTHLGNAVPLLLPRHPNMIWEQLANDNLYAMIIADGHHIPDSFIRVVLKVKGQKTILVSDATMYAGMPPGEYQSTIGGAVVLDEENRLSLKGAGGLLAGAAKDLCQNVATIVNHGILPLELAWQLGSTNVEEMLRCLLPKRKIKIKDTVKFQFLQGRITVLEVVKNEQRRYET